MAWLKRSAIPFGGGGGHIFLVHGDYYLPPRLQMKERGKTALVVKQRIFISIVYPVTGPSLYGICYVTTERAGQTAERRERSWLGGTHLCSLSPTGKVFPSDPGLIKYRRQYRVLAHHLHSKVLLL
jgi:hypothetical protein